MAKLFIKTKLNKVYVVGEFCDWNVDRAIIAERKPNAKTIVVDVMKKGEYKVLSCKSYIGGEVYPTDGRDMCNRYFGGSADETITVYFDREE